MSDQVFDLVILGLVIVAAIANGFAARSIHRTVNRTAEFPSRRRNERVR